MLRIFRWLVIALGLFVQAGTLLSFSRSSHWMVRMWDFPRVQIAGLAAISGTLFGFIFASQRKLFDWMFLVGNALCVLWQASKIIPYTSLASIQVKRSSKARPKKRGELGDSSFRLLISNVQMENQDHQRLLNVIAAEEPDVILTLEINERWAGALEPLRASYPHVISHPQENYYGMILFSRLPLIEPQIRYLVQDDIPSVHVRVELPSGQQVMLHGIHPRPPEPIRDQKSTPRDAELVILGREVGKTKDQPTVVAGDLNDVAWSPTSELFLRLSGLLDPRIGRGFFNSFNANSQIQRYPLDHVFHTGHFRLVDLRVLEHIGSDHFPVLIELSYEPAAANCVRPPEPEDGDEEEADEKIEEQKEAEATGDDRPRNEE